MNITLDNFRTLANGTANLGFVQLTHEDGALGINKANNFKHRVWKNNTSEAASADNLVVRQKLVEAFTNAGASTAFLRGLRTRLGLDNAQDTAEILTRNELKEIFNSYDINAQHAETTGRIFDELAGSHIHDDGQRAMLGEQLRMLKSGFVDAMMTAKTFDESNEVMVRFAQTLDDLRAAFPVNPQPVNAQPAKPQPAEDDPLRMQNEAIERLRQEMAELQQKGERLEKFQQIFSEADEAAEADTVKIRDSIETLPDFSNDQRLKVLDVVLERIYDLRDEMRVDVRKQMVDRNEISADEALYRLKKEWLDVDQAVRKVLSDLCVHGVDPVHGEGELFKELIRTKLEAALDEQPF